MKVLKCISAIFYKIVQHCVISLSLVIHSVCIMYVFSDAAVSSS